ncbi:hypothetical protein, partial [Rhodovulum sulfidophilum]
VERLLVGLAEARNRSAPPEAQAGLTGLAAWTAPGGLAAADALGDALGAGAAAFVRSRGYAPALQAELLRQIAAAGPVAPAP